MIHGRTEWTNQDLRIFYPRFVSFFPFNVGIEFGNRGGGRLDSFSHRRFFCFVIFGNSFLFLVWLTGKIQAFLHQWRNSSMSWSTQQEKASREEDQEGQGPKIHKHLGVTTRRSIRMILFPCALPIHVQKKVMKKQILTFGIGCNRKFIMRWCKCISMIIVMSSMVFKRSVSSSNFCL